MALEELGAEVIALGVEPDGFNINRDVGSTAPEGAGRRRCARCAPISASRSTATPTASCSSTRRAAIIDGDQLMAVVASYWKDEGRLAGNGIVATVMSNLGLERFLARQRPDARAHAGRRPLCQRAHARARLQCRRRAVGPHHPLGLHHDRRRPDRRAAGAGGDPARRPPGERGLPSLRSGAAGA